LLSDGGDGFVGIVMAREKNGLVWKIHQPLGETKVHLLSVAPWQVNPAARADEESVTRYEAVIDEKTLGPRGMAGRVNQLDPDPSYVDLISTLNFDEIGVPSL
jgi:hypothetical protein